MSNIQTIAKPVEPAQLQTVPFSRQELDTFHRFKITGTCLDGLFRRNSYEQPSELVLPREFWKTVFEHLSLRDLFTLFVTAKAWSQAFDPDSMRNQFCWVKGDETGSLGRNFIPFMALEPQILRPIRYFESFGSKPLAQDLSLVQRNTSQDLITRDVQLLSETDVQTLGTIPQLRNHIDRLFLSRAACPEKTLHSVLEAYQSLRELELSVPNGLPWLEDDILFFDHQSFSSIKRITVDNRAEQKGMDILMLQIILENASKLEFLSLDALDYNFEEVLYYNQVLDLEDNSLPCLKQIHIRRLSSDTFEHELHLCEKILKAAPNLEVLDFPFMQAFMMPDGKAPRDDDEFKVRAVREDVFDYWVELAKLGIPYAEKRLDSLLERRPHKKAEVMHYIQSRIEESRLIYDQSLALQKRMMQGSTQSAKRQKIDKPD